jgi:hypothetical protein
VLISSCAVGESRQGGPVIDPAPEERSRCRRFCIASAIFSPAVADFQFMSNRRNKQFAPSYLTGFRGNVNDAAGGVSRAPTAPCRPQPGINIANCAADAVDSSRYRTFTGDNGAKMITPFSARPQAGAQTR